MNDNNRQSWIDWAKVLLIYLMIVAHSGKISSSIDTFICSFHMPAFFFISGYLHKKAPIGKYFKRLIIPALLFSLICYLWWLLTSYLAGNLIVSGNELFWKPLLGLFIYDRTIATPMCGVIWFLVTLFFIKCLMNFCSTWKNKYVILCLALIIIGISFIPEGDFNILYYPERVLVALPFVVLGYFIKNQSLIPLTNKNISWKNGVLFCIAIVILYLLSNYNGRVGIHSFIFGKSIYLFYITAVIGAVTVYLGCIFFNSLSHKLLITISNGTIAILCLHKILLQIINWGNKQYQSNGFIISFVVLVLMIPVIYYFDRYFPIIMGKTNRKIQ